MRRAVVVAVLCGAGGVRAADHPDFSGTWTVAPVEAPAVPVRVGDMGSGWGKTLTIAQSAAELSVEYAYYARGDLQPPMHFAFALDGAERVNTVLTGRGVQEERSTAAWRDGVLEITTTSSFADPETGAAVPVVVTRTLSLGADAKLLVEVTRHGVLGAGDTRTSTVFVRGG